MFSSETYGIQDCMLYDATEYSRTGTGSATCVATNSKTWDNTVNWEFTADIKVTGAASRIDITPPSQSLNYHLGIGENAASQLATYVGKNGGGEDTIAHTSYSINDGTYYTVKITRENGTIKYYFNGNLVRTETTYANVWIDNYSTESVKFTTWRSNSVYIKNMKIKPL